MNYFVKVPELAPCEIIDLGPAVPMSEVRRLVGTESPHCVRMGRKRVFFDEHGGEYYAPKNAYATRLVRDFWGKDVFGSCVVIEGKLIDEVL